MPLYEYQCKKCKHRFEKIQKFSDRPVKKCPECGGPVEKLLHAPAVQFKGSGWYVTDYGGKQNTEATKPEGSDSADAKESKESSKDDKGKEKHKESKPKKETKAESKKSKEKD